MTRSRCSRRARLAPLCLAALLAGCTVDAGDLNLTVVRSWLAEQNPLADAKWVQVRVDGPGLRVGPRRFAVADGQGTLDEVPVGEDRRVTVEGLGYEGNPVSRGRSAPLRIEGGENKLSLYVGRVEDSGGFSFSPDRELPQARAFHSATLLDDGRLLLAGGITEPWRPESDDPLPQPTATMTLLDGNSLAVTQSSPEGCSAGAPGCMVSPRVGHSATVLASGNVLIAGGSDGSQPVERAELFSPEEGRFVRTSALKRPRQWHRAVAMGDGALLVGGSTEAGNGLPAELYSGGTVTAEPGLLTGRRAFTLTRMAGGTLVAAGGIDGSGRVLDSVELLAPGAPTWTAAPLTLHSPRAYHSATLLEDGSILLVGGLAALDGVGLASATIERLDLKQGNTQQLSVKLRGARWGHTASLLPDGRVLIVGGFSGNRFGPPSPAVEQLSFFSGGAVQLRPLANLRQARAGHSATVMPSGALVVVGGLSSTGLSATAEIFIY